MNCTVRVYIYIYVYIYICIYIYMCICIYIESYVEIIIHNPYDCCIHIYIYIIHLHRSIDAQLCTVYVYKNLLLLPHLITLPYFHNERYAIFGADSAGLNWLIRENEAFDRWQRRKCDVRPLFSLSLTCDGKRMEMASKKWWFNQQEGWNMMKYDEIWRYADGINGLHHIIVL